MYPITTITTSLLALIYLFLSVKVIGLRKFHKISIGAKENQLLERAMRAHGNFAEYVPLSILLIACSEVNRANTIFLAILAGMVVSGRLTHAYAFLYHKQHFTPRTIGMILTFLAIIILAFLNLVLLFV